MYGYIPEYIIKLYYPFEKRDLIFSKVDNKLNCNNILPVWDLIDDNGSYYMMTNTSKRDIVLFIISTIERNYKDGIYGEITEITKICENNYWRNVTEEKPIKISKRY